MAREAKVHRRTNETDITVEIDLDGAGRAEIKTGQPFMDHMLTLAAYHGRFDLKIAAAGDLEIDGHHTTEDLGLCLGQAVSQALGGKKGIERYGQALVPMDEALARAVIDLSGRPHLSYRVPDGGQYVGEFEAGLVREFFQALANEARLTLHLDAWHGVSVHHVLEAVFKAFGRAFRQAATVDPGRGTAPSTKGIL